MIGIGAKDLGRQFHRRWVFRHLDLHVPPGGMLGIMGANGSGKSTLLRILAGQLGPTEGVAYAAFASGKPLSPEAIYKHLSWNGPYVDAYTDLSLAEAYRLHFRFKACLLTGGPLACIHAVELAPHQHKPMRTFSSGMLQRAKLGMALFSECQLLVLDEPTSFMDEINAQSALELVAKHRANRTLVLASNLPRECAAFNGMEVFHMPA